MSKLLMRQKTDRKVKKMNKTNMKLMMKAKIFQSRNKNMHG